MKIIAIDPGKTCGYAIFKEEELEKASQSKWDVFLLLLEDQIDEFDTVVIEKYRIRQNTISANLGKNLRTVKVIGVLEWFCKQACINCHLQEAGIGKDFFDRKRLEELDLWVKGEPHARDAIRHGLWYLTFGDSNGEE